MDGPLNLAPVPVEKSGMGGTPGFRLGGALALGTVLLTACATATPGEPGWRFVPGMTSVDPAGGKIMGWQSRAQEPADATATGVLGARFDAFVSERRHALADEVRAWIQDEARSVYVSDSGVDRWPTFAEVRASAGDDCDGLELLALHALRSLGFPDESLFRAVIEHEGDGVQHMVTLWFAEADDPVVIDPTGFAATRLLRLSELQGWAPRAIFTEAAAYRVESTNLAPAGAPE